MYHEQGIFDDMEFESTSINPKISNPYISDNSKVDINTVLIIVVIVVIISAAGTYYWTRKKYENKSAKWIG